MIPPFPGRRISLIDFLVAGAIPVMIIDDSACLEVGVNRDCAHILEATLFQILSDPVRKTVADRDCSDIVPLVQIPNH